MWGIACCNEFCSLSESNFWSQQFWCIDFQPHTCLVNKISSQALVCVSKSFLLRQIKYFNLQVLAAFVLNCTQVSKCRGSKLQMQGWGGQSLKVLMFLLTLGSCWLLVPGASCLQLHSSSLCTWAVSAWACAWAVVPGAGERLAAAARCSGQAKLCPASQAALRMALLPPAYSVLTPRLLGWWSSSLCSFTTVWRLYIIFRYSNQATEQLDSKF